MIGYHPEYDGTIDHSLGDGSIPSITTVAPDWLGWLGAGFFSRQQFVKFDPAYSANDLAGIPANLFVQDWSCLLTNQSLGAGGETRGCEALHSNVCVQVTKLPPRQAICM